MAAIKNPRHEAFAQRVAEGMSGAAAYRAAISNTCTTTSAIEQGSRLLANVNVRSRVEELRKQTSDILRDSLGVTRETLLRYYVEILETPVGDFGMGAGLGVRYTLGRNVSLRFDYGWQLDDGPGFEDSSQAHFGIEVSY